MASTGLHISLSAETLFSVGGVEITNSIFTSLIISTLLILFAVAVRLTLDTKTKRPTGLQNVAEFIIESLWKLVREIAGEDKKARKFFPFIATFFLFIILNNYFGLLPGVGTIGIFEKPANETAVEEHAQVNNSIVPQALASETVEAVVEDSHEETPQESTAVSEEHAKEAAPTAEEHAAQASTAGHGPKFVPIFRPGTADLNTTIALAIISMFMVQFFGVSHLGLAYFGKFFNFSNPINFYVGILELVSEFAKILSFAFRLFGNIFAGEVLLVVIGALAPLVAPMPFYGLELFVGFIQALVFSMLSLVFFNMATHGHEEH